MTEQRLVQAELRFARALARVRWPAPAPGSYTERAHRELQVAACAVWTETARYAWCLGAEAGGMDPGAAAALFERARARLERAG